MIDRMLFDATKLSYNATSINWFRSRISILKGDAVRCILLAILMCIGLAGCGGGNDTHVNMSEDGITVDAPGVHVETGPGGAEVTAPGVRVDAGEDGADVSAPGVNVRANEDGASVTAPGADVDAGRGAFDDNDRHPERRLGK